MKRLKPLVLFTTLLVACSAPEPDIFEIITSELEALDRFEKIECRTKPDEGLQTVCFKESHQTVDAQPESEGPYKGYSKGMFTITKMFEDKENWRVFVGDNGWINVPPDSQMHMGQLGNYILKNNPENVEYIISQSTLHPVESNGLILDTTKTSEHTLTYKTSNAAETP